MRNQKDNAENLSRQSIAGSGRHQGRFLLKALSEFTENCEVQLSGQEAHHLLHTRRAKAGDHLELFDGQGCVWSAELLSTTAGTASCQLLKPLASTPTQAWRLTLVTAVPKPKRMSFLVEKSAELGVAEIIPVAWDRSQRQGSDNSNERWRRLALSAAKQSRSATLMRIADSISAAELPAALSSFDTVLLLDPAGRTPLSKALSNLALNSSLAVLIGPEGGFSEADSEMLELLPPETTHRISLGENILRVETAAIAASAAILSQGLQIHNAGS
jgi:16S rRNA (uracil1498-N3)-methyltransferase